MGSSEAWSDGEANARLVAAAPDLLRCLHLVETIYRLNFVTDGEPSSILQDMQDTIAKATGAQS
jgi:hypothetical protein